MSTIDSFTLISAIAEEGNMTAAANKLYVSQPYLSKMLKQLEEKYGVQFFQRLPRSMQLTYAGERYLDYLRYINNVKHDMENELTMISQHKRGRVKISINPALGSSLLPLILPEFMEAYPNVKVDLYEENAETSERLLEDNLIDIYIGMLPASNPNLDYRYIYDDQMHLVIPSTFDLYDPKLDNQVVPFPYDLDVLSSIPLILLKPTYGIRRLIDHFYSKNDLKPNIVLETDTIYTAVGLARKGAGATFVPKTGMSWPTFNNCNIFRFDEHILMSEFVIYSSKDRILSPNVLSFIDLTERILSEKSQSFRFGSTTHQ